MPTTQEKTTSVQLRRFNTDEYHRLAEAGILRPGEHVELLDGVIYEKHTNGRKRRFSVEEYYKMARGGVLKPDEKLELIEGRIYEEPDVHTVRRRRARGVRRA